MTVIYSHSHWLLALAIGIVAGLRAMTAPSRRGADFGVVTAGPIQMDMARVKARADAVVLRARTGIESWFHGMPGCTVLIGQARFEGPDTIRVGEARPTAPRILYRRFGSRPTQTA